LYSSLILLAFWLIPSGLSAEEFSLADLCRSALQTAERIKYSEENIKIAEAGKSKSLSYLLPRLTTFAGLTSFTESKYGDTKSIVAGGSSIPFPGSLIQANTVGTWGIRLDETLSLGGREFTSYRISGENLDRSRFETYALKEDYLLAVALAYYNVLKARKSLEIADANVERLAKYQAAAEKRLRVGEVTRTVLLRAEAELSGALSEQMTARNLLALAMAQLKRIAGLEGEVQLKDDPPASTDLPAVSTFQAVALSERSDLKGLDIQKKQAEEQIRYAKGANWPSLSLSGVYSGLDQSPQSSTMNRESIYATIVLNFPIFEGGLRVAEIREARSKEKQSGYLYEDLKKTIEIEVQSAYLDLMTQKATLKFLQDQLVFARDNYQAIARQFELGLVNSIDVIDANTLLVSAEQKLSDAGYNYQMAIIRIKKAAGVLFKEILAKN